MSEISFGRKLMGLVVDLEEKPTTSPTAVPTAPTAPSIPAQAQGSSESMIDPAMLETVQTVINARKTPYTALIETVERLKNVPMDDNTRLQAALTMVTADGVRNIDSITKAIDIHIADVNGELARFTQTSKGMTETKVLSLRAAATDLNDQIESSKKQIEQLQQAVIANLAKAEDLKRQADDAEREIAVIAAKFNATAEFVKQDLQAKKVSLATTIIK